MNTPAITPPGSLGRSWGQEDDTKASFMGAGLMSLEHVLSSGLLSIESLTELDLSGNEFSIIPPELSMMPFLETLNLGHNQLTLKDLEKNRISLLSLRRLNLRHNRIGSLPQQFFEMAPQLIELDLADNQLHGLPDCISVLSSTLTSIDLHENRLATLPKSFRLLSKLEKLNLANNDLELLPDVSAFPNLNFLSLRENENLNLPPKLHKLPLVHFIAFLRGNQPRKAIPSLASFDAPCVYYELDGLIIQPLVNANANAASEVILRDANHQIKSDFSANGFRFPSRVVLLEEFQFEISYSMKREQLVSVPPTLAASIATPPYIGVLSEHSAEKLFEVPLVGFVITMENEEIQFRRPLSASSSSSNGPVTFTTLSRDRIITFRSQRFDSETNRSILLFQIEKSNSFPLLFLPINARPSSVDEEQRLSLLLDAIADLERMCFSPTEVWSKLTWQSQLQKSNHRYFYLTLRNYNNEGDRAKSSLLLTEEMTDSKASQVLDQIPIVGICGVQIYKESCSANVATLSVHPGCRGLGAGALLLLELISLVSRQGCVLLTLQVKQTNTTAIKLYERLGFRIVSELPKYYGNREDAFLMGIRWLDDLQNLPKWRQLRAETVKRVAQFTPASLNRKLSMTLSAQMENLSALNLQRNISFSFHRLAMLICSRCRYVEFPGCGAHKCLLSRAGKRGTAKCPDVNCKTSTSRCAPWNSVCRHCKYQPADVEWVHVRVDALNLLRTAFRNLSSTAKTSSTSPVPVLRMVNDKQMPIPTFGSLCVMCRAFEFGVEGPRLLLLKDGRPFDPATDSLLSEARVSVHADFCSHQTQNQLASSSSSLSARCVFLNLLLCADELEFLCEMFPKTIPLQTRVEVLRSNNYGPEEIAIALHSC